MTIYAPWLPPFTTGLAVRAEQAMDAAQHTAQRTTHTLYKANYDGVVIFGEKSLKTALTLVPSAVAPTTITPAMNAIINAYSAAEAPEVDNIDVRNCLIMLPTRFLSRFAVGS